jgi:hypothetical protein
MKNKQLKSIANNLVRILFSVIVFLSEIAAVGERAWMPAVFFGASLVFIILPASVLPLWSWKKRYIFSLMLFIVAIILLPYPTG